MPNLLKLKSVVSCGQKITPFYSVVTKAIVHAIVTAKKYQRILHLRWYILRDDTDLTLGHIFSVDSMVVCRLLSLALAKNIYNHGCGIDK